MIARIWRDRVHRGMIEEYRAYMEATGLSDLRATPGNVAAYMFTRESDAYDEVIVLSLWESLESISAFAGADISIARYYDEDARFLVEMPRSVEHYDVTA